MGIKYSYSHISRVLGMEKKGGNFEDFSRLFGQLAEEQRASLIKAARHLLKVQKGIKEEVLMPQAKSRKTSATSATKLC
jgi:hypothetical protein